MTIEDLWRQFAARPMMDRLRVHQEKFVEAGFRVGIYLILSELVANLKDETVPPSEIRRMIDGWIQECEEFAGMG